MKDELDKLLPCPWCHSSEHLKIDPVGGDNFDITCWDCRAGIAFGPEVGDKAEAITAWNTRAPSAQAVGQPELDKLRALHEAATPGPWKATGTDPAEGYDCWWLTACPIPNGETEIGSIGGGYPHAKREATAQLIVALRNALPDLIAQAERANTLEAALHFYADPEMWLRHKDAHSPVEIDDGEVARTSLEQTGTDHAR